MYETDVPSPRAAMALLLVFLMAIPAFPANAWSAGSDGNACGRSVTDDAKNLIVPAGESYELWGCHTYSQSVQIEGTLTVKLYDGSDSTTGVLFIKAPSIIVGSAGSISALGTGWTGGAAGTSNSASKGFGGKGPGAGKDGSNSDSNNNAGGGGGGGASFGGKGAPGGAGGDANDDGAQGGPGGAAGSTYGDNMAAVLEIGSGGGGGGCSGGSGFQVGTAGGRGGGALWLEGISISIAGTVTADGAIGGKGGTSPSNWNHGAGGGGGASGGTVILSAAWVNVTGSVSARGGRGGDGGAGDGSGPTGHTGAGGGGGGGGRIKIFYGLNGFQDKMNVDGGGAGAGANHDMPQGNVAGSAGTIYLNGRPPAPALQDPSDGGSAPSVRPTLTWKSSADPEGEPVTYDIQLFSDANLATLELEHYGLKDTSYTSEEDLVKGTYYWRVRANDPAGPGLWSGAWKMFTDTVPPESSVAALPKYETNASFRVSWTGTDDIAGIGTYDIFVAEGLSGQTFLPWLEDTRDTTAVFEGMDGQSYSFYSVAVDRALNREADPGQPDATTIVDASPPVTTMTALTPFQGSLRFQLSWSGKDATSGVQYYNVFIADGESDFTVLQEHYAKTSFQFDADDGHDYKFYIVGCDNAGNWEAMPSPSKILKTRVDLTPPEVTLRLGNPNFGLDPVYITAATSMYLDSSDNFAGVNVTAYNIDGRGAKAYTNSIKEGAPGPHNMTYWGTDKAGNKCENGTLWFFVDSEAPATVVSYEGPGFISGDRIFVTAQTSVVLTATDAASGVNYIEYNLDKRSYTRYAAPLKFTTGTHNLVLRAQDKVGNTEIERSLTIMVDTLAPTTRTDGDFSTVSREDITFGLVATDLDSGVAQTFFRVLREKDKTGDYQAGTTVTVEASSGDGNYTVQYYSVDRVNNAEKAKELKLRIDTQVALALVFEGPRSVSSSKYLLEGKTEPGAKITIGINDVLVSADGSFAQEMTLKPGKNTIHLLITDQAGNTRDEAVTVTYNQPVGSADWFLPLVIIIVVVAVVAVAAFMVLGGKKGAKPPARPPQGRAPPPVPPARMPPPRAPPARAAPVPPARAPPARAPPARAPSPPPVRPPTP